MRTYCLSALAATAVVLGACTVDLNDALPNSAWSAEQTAEMADGTVTFVEYHEAFRRFANCMSEGGSRVAFVDKREDRIDYSVPSAAVDSGLDEICYEREFGAVDMSWQIANPDPELVAMYRQCLISQGMAVPDTADEMVNALLDSGIDPGSCR